MVHQSFNVARSSTVTSATTFVSTREVHKFGGSNLADVGCFLRVSNIVREHCGPDDLFVVSAAGKTASRLEAFADQCGHDPFAARVELASLFEYQLELVNGLLIGTAQKKLSNALRTEFTLLRGMADEIVEPTHRAHIIGHGEVWAARLLTALLNQFGLLSEWLDSREVLRAEPSAQPVIDQTRSAPLVQFAVQSRPGLRIVITGSMASDQDGKTVFLGDKGSDYAATTIGILAGSQCITIWSDLAVVYTADPRMVDTAQLLPSLSLAEANELAKLGAPVLHRRSLEPVIDSNVTVALRSSYDPFGDTTTMDRDISAIGAKVVTSVDSIAVFSVSSPSGESCERFARLAEESIRNAQLEPIAVHVPATHGAVRFLFLEEHAADAANCLESAGFTVAQLEDQHSLIAAVGAGVAHSTADRETFLKAIQSNDGVNATPELIVSSDLSLAALLKSIDIRKVLNKVHAAFIGNA